MKNSKAIRIQLGMTQSEMANYLQINRSQMAMFENGKRDLSTQALVKLAEMELFLVNYKNQPQNKSLPHEAAQLLKAEEILAQHQRELEYQQMVLQKKLEKFQNNYQHNMQLLAFLTQLEEKNINADAILKSWMAMTKITATRNIEANGLHHQLKIKLQLQMNIPQG